MKNILLFTILLFCVTLNAQIINVPDSNFKSYLLGNSVINTNGNSEIEFSEATSYTGTLDLNALQISDLTGIEYFIETKVIDASQNWISTTPDLSLLSKLVNLNLNQNYLTAITLGNHPHLRILDIGSNPNLTATLDITGCIAMTQFLCFNAKPAGLDFSMSPQLDTLSLSNHNAVGALDLSNNTELSVFSSSSCTISSVTFAASSNLEYVQLTNSTVASLDVSGNPSLKSLLFYAGIPSSKTISDLSNNPLLERIILVDISNSSNINLNNHPQLNNVVINNSNLSSFDLSNMPILEVLNLHNNNLIDIDLSACPLLEYIGLNDNNMTSLEVSSNPLLEQIHINDNNLTELDLSDLTVIEELEVRQNNLSCILFPSSIPSLYRIFLEGNQLTRLDVSTTGVSEMSVANNQLSYLNIANGKSNESWFTFDATGNPAACINTDDITYSIFFQGDFKDASATFSASCTDLGSCTIITCAMPNNQMVEMTTATTALFTWDAVPNASLYQVKYRLKGTTSWLTAGTTNPQRTISNLTAKKYYQYKVRAECSAGDWSDFTSVELFYTSACDEPTGVASIYLDNARMRIRWDNNPNEIKAKVRYREVGTATWYTQNSTPGQNYIYINGLTPNATYQYRVRSNCSGNDWSAYTGVYTHDLSNVLRLEQEETTLIETKIYPNPVKEVLNIEFQTQNAEDISITITNSLGKMIQTINNSYDEGIQRENININQLTKGYYFITIRSEDRIETQKFLRIE
ncbi:MAG: hypothetical protein ACI94Y_000652 [Maribacter sp.]|jgi:hypothetical protein